MEQKKTTVIGDIIKEMVIVLWEKLIQYAGQKVLKFSTRKLDGFKVRHNIKKYRQYGESGSINLVIVKEKLQEIQEVINLYTNENVYNIDEFGLFWKMTLDGTLGIE